MANITKIDHGSANWEKAVNDNFATLSEDTGWVQGVFFAPVKIGDSGNTVTVRRYHGRIEFAGSVVIGEDVTQGGDPTVNKGLRLFSLPEGFGSTEQWIWCNLPDVHAFGTIRCSVRGDGVYLHQSVIKGTSIDFGQIPSYSV